MLGQYFGALTRETAVLRLDIWSEATRNPAIAAMTARTEAEARAWFVETFAGLATAPDCDPVALYALLGAPDEGHRRRAAPCCPTTTRPRPWRSSRP